MEDGFPFPLWVEGDWNPGTPKLKNKLNIYFQSRKANGGDCLVEYEASDGQRAVARFKTEDARQRVLDKQRHELKLGQGVLKLTVRLPQAEECSNFPGTSGEISSLPSAGLPTGPDGADEKTPSTQTQEETKEMDTVQEAVEAEPELETASVLLENVPEKMSREMIEMLVENISDTSAELDFNVEIIPEICGTVVSFKNSKHASHFLAMCPSKKMFRKNNLSARLLEVTKCVKVHKIPRSASTDYLQLYFEREGNGEVEELIQLDDEECALITFRHHKGVSEVTKKMHCILQTPIGVYPYYKSLGTALYGKERLKLPDSFTESMDAVVWKFLQDKKQVEEINEIMGRHFCKIDLQGSEVLMSPLKQKGLNAQDINSWKENAITAFRLAISKFQSFECKVMPAVWKESETEIRERLTEAVVIVPDMDRGVVALAGLATDVNTLKDVLVDSVNAATRKLERKRDSIIVEASVAPAFYHILQQDGLPQTIATDYPELKMTYSQEDQKMIFCGMSTEVYAAKSKVLEEVVGMKRKVVDVEENVRAFLFEADKEELCDILFTVAGIKATYETCHQIVQIFGGTQQALDDAEKQLKAALGSYSIMVEDENVLSKPEWQDLVTRLQESFNSPGKKVKVRRTAYDTKPEIVVSGFQDSVNVVGQELSNFMSCHTIDEVTMDIKSRATLTFIEDHKKETWSKAVEKDVEIHFNYETRKPSIRLHGPRAHVTEFKNSLQNIISSVHFDTMKISKPGAKKLFKEKLKEMAVPTTECVVQLMEEDEEEGFANNNLPQARLVPGEKHRGKVQMGPDQHSVQTKEGLTIIQSKGKIEDAPTDVIVNTLAEKLNLNSGAVSSSILKGAGPELQNLVHAEAARNNPMIGAVLITKGCNLKCKHVFHAIAPHWGKGKGNAQKELEGIVEECLEKAEELRQGSIAFPAIGTGNLGYPKDFVASMMLGQVIRFSSKKNPKHLQEVVIVLHPSDAQTSQAFDSEFSKRFTGISADLGQPTNPATAPTQPGKALFSKVTAITQGNEMRVGRVLLQVVSGDITTETSDVIVNSSNSNFTLSAGVSKAILDAAGPTVVTECKQLGAQANKDMIMTQPGNLKSKKIVHIVGQTDITKITGSVKAVLQMCAQNKFTSVSFPALGTGQGGVNASQVADAMLDALADVVKQDPAMSLQLVRLVIFQAPMLTHFHSSMQKKESTGTQPEAPKTGAFKKLTRIFWKGDRKEDKKKAKTFTFEGKKLDPLILHLCGGSQANVEDGKRWIQQLLQKELVFEKVTDEAVLDLLEVEQRNIHELQEKLQVSVKLEEGDPEASIIVEGLTRDVLKAVGDIQRMLKVVRVDQTQKRDAELMSNLVEWQYQQSGQYLPFDQLPNLELERARESQQPDVTINISGLPYKVSLPNGPAVDTSGNQLQIKRINKLEAQDSLGLPNHWSAMRADQQCLMIPLQAGAAEYNEVLQLFQATCPRAVSKIERVQNRCLWMNYQILKQDMDQINGHKNNEKRLFHGTSLPTIQHINHRGFNRSYAGKNAAAIGNGTYFAVGANYSASSTYSVPDPQGQKYMYLCRVLTGDFTTGRGGMIVPPPKSNSSHLLYNSVTDNPGQPSMFVIFNDIQAYPEYLLSFR